MWAPSRKTEVRIYYRLILIYSNEVWTLLLREENQLLLAEKKFLRKTLHLIKREDGDWRVRTNSEIDNLVAEPKIFREIKLIASDGLAFGLELK